MGSGYRPPTDRPFRIWCRACQSYRDNLGKNCRNEDWPPKDLSRVGHDKCPCGALVYVYEDVAPAIPGEERITPVITGDKWHPKCGDPKCDGTCDNIACIPLTPPSTDVPDRRSDIESAAYKAFGDGVISVLVIESVIGLLWWLWRNWFS